MALIHLGPPKKQRDHEQTSAHAENPSEEATDQTHPHKAMPGRLRRCLWVAHWLSLSAKSAVLDWGCERTI